MTGAAGWSGTACSPSISRCSPRVRPGHSIHYISLYRVFSKARNAVGPSKSLIFWTFPGVLGLFRPFNMGDFSFWYFWDM